MDMTVTEVELIPNKPVRHRYRTKIYVWPRGENVLQNLENRRSRPIKAFRQAAKKALEGLGVDHSSLDIRWSQRAGCGCGCSPGFIVEGWNERLYRNDLHVTVE